MSLKKDSLVAAFNYNISFSGLESNVDYRDENTLLACINGDCLYNSRNTFKTASDITSFLSQSFKRNSIVSTRFSVCFSAQ